MSDNFLSIEDLKGSGGWSFTKFAAMAIVLLALSSVIAVISYNLGSLNSPLSGFNSTDSTLATSDVASINTQDKIAVSPAPSVIESESGAEGTLNDPLSPTPTRAQQSRTITMDAVPELDGYRNSTGTGKRLAEIRVGMGPGLVSRGFVSFPIDSLPRGSFIKNATLRLYQVETDGNPYQKGGDIVIDHLSYGTTLDEIDYAAPSFLYSFATLSDNPNIQYKEVDVTAQLRDDHRNAKSTTQFRLHFEVEIANDDDSFDFAYFESAENHYGTGNTPELVVEYSIN